MERNSGYFLVWRKIWKSPVFKNHKQCAIWIYMISQATHQDKTLNFLDNKIFVKKAELIFPLRKNAEIWGITYSEMRTFIKRLKNRKMINVRMHHLLPTSNHPSRKISIICPPMKTISGSVCDALFGRDANFGKPENPILGKPGNPD